MQTHQVRRQHFQSGHSSNQLQMNHFLYILLYDLGGGVKSLNKNYKTLEDLTTFSN